MCVYTHRRTHTRTHTHAHLHTHIMHACIYIHARLATHLNGSPMRARRSHAATSALMCARKCACVLRRTRIRADWCEHLPFALTFTSSACRRSPGRRCSTRILRRGTWSASPPCLVCSIRRGSLVATRTSSTPRGARPCVLRTLRLRLPASSSSLPSRQ